MLHEVKSVWGKTRGPETAGRPEPFLADLLVEHNELVVAFATVPHVASTEDLLRQVEESQDAVDRLGLGGGGSWAALEAMSDLGVRLLKVVAAIPSASAAELRRRQVAYARQRCGAAMTALLDYALERDRRRLGLSLRDLASA